MRVLSALSGLTAVALLIAGGAVAGGSVAAASGPRTSPFLLGPAAVVSHDGSTLDLPPTAAAVVVRRTAAKPRYAFPVPGSRVSFAKKNAHAGYPATDIFTACGRPVVATTSGVVLEVSRVDKYKKGRPDGPYNGGKFVSIRGDDGVRYYGSHLSTLQAGIKRGVRVKAGQVLGKVGRTGNASGVCHLHYGISPPCKRIGDWKVRRGVVWPATYLSSWRKGGQKSPTPAVKAWQKKRHCRA